jgi:tetratricopeptide (TPR) repeat protein
MKWGWVGLLSVGLANVAQAQLAPPKHPVDQGSPQSEALASQSAENLIRGRAGDALQVANDAISADARNPWAHYDKAAALGNLGRTDDAVAEFRVAQSTFSNADPWGRSVAIYGRANTLAQAGRCNEAQPAFEEYASFVEPNDATAAAQARQISRECVPRRP